MALKAVLAALVIALAGCSSEPSATTEPPPSIERPFPLPTSGNLVAPPGAQPDGPFAETDAQIAKLVEAPVDWHSPSRLAVDESFDIGLSIGDTAELRRQIAEALPGTTPSSGGTVGVSPDAAAVLVVDPEEALVEPNAKVNASTGSDIGLLWTWKVHPLRPVQGLRLTARIDVTLPATGQARTRFVTLTVPVDRTVKYTAQQVFTNWATWAAIVAAITSGFGWLWRSRRSKTTRASARREHSVNRRHRRSGGPGHPRGS